MKWAMQFILTLFIGTAPSRFCDSCPAVQVSFVFSTYFVIGIVTAGFGFAIVYLLPI